MPPSSRSPYLSVFLAPSLLSLSFSVSAPTISLPDTSFFHIPSSLALKPSARCLHKLLSLPFLSLNQRNGEA